jgi:hypothetical protein
MRPFLALLRGALPVFAQEQQPQPVHVDAPIHVTAIDVVADVRDASGKLPQGLTPAMHGDLVAAGARLDGLEGLADRFGITAVLEQRRGARIGEDHVDGAHVDEPVHAAQLQEGAFTGDLPVEARVEGSSANPARKQGSLHVVSKLPGAPARGDFRFTLAVLVPPGQAFVTTKPLTGFRLNDGAFDMRTPLDLPPATSVVVISIEDMATGMWGSSRIQLQ